MRRRFSIATFALLATPFFAPLVGAQDRLIPVGTKVRFRIGESSTLHVAQLARFTRDSLILQSCSTCDRLGYARGEINHLEAHRNQYSGFRAAVGSAVGALVGLVVGIFVVKSCQGGDKCYGHIVAVPAGFLFGGLIGALVGYFTSYNWEPVGGS